MAVSFQVLTNVRPFFAVNTTTSLSLFVPQNFGLPGNLNFLFHFRCNFDTKYTCFASHLGALFLFKSFPTYSAGIHFIFLVLA
jgi:hypothetical protein